MRKHVLFIVFLSFLGVGTLSAQKYSNEFLSLGIGAQAQAMGNSIVASVDDVTAGYWNPAALAAIDLKGMQLGGMHAEWFAGIGKFDYLGMALPISKGKRALGITAIRFGIDDIPNTLNLYDDDGSINFDNVVGFSSADYALMGSYSQYIFTHLGKLYVGGNVKVIHRTIGKFAQAWGFGIDASIQWRHDHWNFGFMARDISNTFNSWTFDFNEEEKKILEATSNLVPSSSLEVTRPQLILATAYHNQWHKFGLLAELDLNVSLDGERNTLIRSNPYSIDPTIGLELNYGEFIFLRAGLNQWQQTENIDGQKTWTNQPNLGIGLKFMNLRIDYALTDVGQQDQRTYSHVISVVLGLDFNYLKKAVKNAGKKG
ncbi:MAG: hypothetical protein AAF990_02180 [Bacteroidota bacterium]